MPNHQKVSKYYEHDCRFQAILESESFYGPELPVVVVFAKQYGYFKIKIKNRFRSSPQSPQIYICTHICAFKYIHTHKKVTSSLQYKPGQTRPVIVARILLEVYWNITGFSKL